MEVQQKRYITPEEYLEIERAALFKSEYYAGEMFAMAGASVEHNMILNNIVSSVRPLLKTRGCDVFTSDVRVHVVSSTFFAYPDIIIVCGPNYHDGLNDTILNPSVIVEILSPSTEAYDRGTKFSFYRKLPSLQFYLLVSQDTQRVEIFSKNEQGSWVLSEYAGSESIVPIESPNFSLRIPLPEIYDGVL